MSLRRVNRRSSVNCQSSFHSYARLRRLVVQEAVVAIKLPVSCVQLFPHQMSVVFARMILPERTK